MEPAKTIEEYQAQINAIRLDAHKRRAAAWAMVPETVLGIELNPITPAIFSLLTGTGNAYFTGRVPSGDDLWQFIWFCSPHFNPDAPIASLRWRWLQRWRLKIALLRGATWSNRNHVMTANFYRACLDIHEIIRGTFSDSAAPVENDEPELPLAASLEAQVIDMFAREYRQWPMPKPVRHTPIKQLYQLARCIDRTRLGKEAKYHDSEENRCTKRFLENLNPARN